MTDFIAAQADLILPELVGGYAPEYVNEPQKLKPGLFKLLHCIKPSVVPIVPYVVCVMMPKKRESFKSTIG